MSDLIDRQAAIDYIKLQKRRRFDGMTIEEAIVTMINEVPSAQPECGRLGKAIANKSANEIYDFLKWLMFDYGNQFTDSREAVVEWLKGEKI